MQNNIKHTILIDGTSSAGKTSIVKLFDDSYKKVISDDYKAATKKLLFAETKNKYQNHYNLYKNKLYELMVKDVLKYNKVVIDDIKPYILNFLHEDDVVKILLYTNLDDLVTNIISRMKTNPRRSLAFRHYADKYVKTTDKNKSIDRIDLNSFINSLKRMKWDYESEEQLVNFAKNIFTKMDISDTKSHFIKVRNADMYELIISSKGKTSKELYNEIICFSSNMINTNYSQINSANTTKIFSLNL